MTFFKNELIKYKDKYVLVIKEAETYLINIGVLTEQKLNKLSDLEAIFGKIDENYKYTVQ